MLTKEQIRKYLEVGSGFCPSCGSEEIEGDSFNIDHGAVYQEMRCLNCDTRWVDGYTLDRVGHGEGDDFVIEDGREENEFAVEIFIADGNVEFLRGMPGVAGCSAIIRYSHPEGLLAHSSNILVIEPYPTPKEK